MSYRFREAQRLTDHSQVLSASSVMTLGLLGWAGRTAQPCCFWVGEFFGRERGRADGRWRRTMRRGTPVLRGDRL